MTQKKLSEYFKGAAAKYLSAVDAEPSRSNQHEIGSSELKKFLGDPGTNHVRFKAKFIFLGNSDDDTEKADSEVTWYDSRAGVTHRGPEYRLYYKTNAVTKKMSERDFLVVAKHNDGSIWLILTESGSSDEHRLKQLFDIRNFTSSKLTLFDVNPDTEIGFAEKFLFEELGIEVDDADENYLEDILVKFGDSFPTTKEFSEYSRTIASSDIPAIEQPDDLLLTWLGMEEILFKTLENHLVSKQLEIGFSDVDFFIKYSLSIQNRRKSRAGQSLENHLEEIFKLNDVRYSRGKTTENKSKPDFLFPDISYYHDNSFSSEKLTMLGSKSTCKDRWRQVLTEAAKIDHKHLFTLEPGISENQTDEMIASNLQLVIPQELFRTYTVNQQGWLCNLKDFVGLVKLNE